MNLHKQLLSPPAVETRIALVLNLRGVPKLPAVMHPQIHKLNKRPCAPEWVVPAYRVGLTIRDAIDYIERRPTYSTHVTDDGLFVVRFRAMWPENRDALYIGFSAADEGTRLYDAIFEYAPHKVKSPREDTLLRLDSQDRWPEKLRTPAWDEFPWSKLPVLTASQFRLFGEKVIRSYHKGLSDTYRNSKQSWRYVGDERWL